MGLDVTGRYRYPPPDPAWLALHDEPVIAPELPIIDAHHHVWNEAGNAYLLDELAADVTSGHKIVATVCVQGHYGYRADGPEELRPVGESEKVAALAADARARGLGVDVCAGFVAFADLMLGGRVAPVIEAHRAAAPDRLRGIRHSVSRDPLFPDGIVLRPAPAGMLADPQYRAGLAEVARQGLSYDAMLYDCQIGELTEMARALPDLPVILDHYGCIIGVGPRSEGRREQFERWRGDIGTLALCPNVSIKLGGMGMVICGAQWHERAAPPGSEELAETWRPYSEACVEAFGADRCMFESNFPVDKSQFSYRVLWNAYKRLAAGASDAERAALFHDTAARVYRLGHERVRALNTEQTSVKG